MTELVEWFENFGVRFVMLFSKYSFSSICVTQPQAPLKQLQGQAQRQGIHYSFCWVKRSLPCELFGQLLFLK